MNRNKKRKTESVDDWAYFFSFYLKVKEEKVRNWLLKEKIDPFAEMIKIKDNPLCYVGKIINCNEYK